MAIFEHNCDAFVVNASGMLFNPNAEGKYPNYSFNMHVESVNSFMAENGCDLRVGTDDILIENWITGEGVSNWNDHQIPHAIQEELGMPSDQRHWFPSFLPERLFRGKKEGDVVTLRFARNGNVVYLNIRLNQLGYRYADKGRYEEALATSLRYAS